MPKEFSGLISWLWLCSKARNQVPAACLGRDGRAQVDGDDSGLLADGKGFTSHRVVLAQEISEERR